MADSKFMDGVFANKKKFANGGSVTKMAIKKDRLIEWLKNAPEHNGYVKVQVQGSKEPKFDDYGNEKLVVALDSYFYQDQQQAPTQFNPQNYTPPSSQAPAQQVFDDEMDVDGSSVPF